MYDSKGRTIKDEVLTKHTPMVKKLAHQLKAKLPPNIEVDDLIQAGMIGLLDALSKYEEFVAQCLTNSEKMIGCPVELAKT